MSLKPYPEPTYWQRLKVAFQYVFPQLPVTRLAGWLAEQRWGAVTHFAIKMFVKQYKVNLTEAQKTEPSDYASFNEFFIRPLKENARPINQEAQTLCLPADGKVSEAGNIEDDRLLQAKGHSFTLESLLAND